MIRKVSRKSSRKTSKKSCPAGKILRKSYSRKNPRNPSKKIKVRSACVPDTGAPGKTPASRRILPQPEKSILRQFGYATDKSQTIRHKALRMALKKYDSLEVLRHLNLIRNLNPHPDAKEILSDDVKYLSNLYQRKSSRKGSRMSSRKGSRKSSRKGSRRYN